MNRFRKFSISVCFGTLLFPICLPAQSKNQPKQKVSAIQVMMVESDQVPLPAEFRVALYENVVRQIQKVGFSHVYREGDRNAEHVDDLVVLRTIVRNFKAGSERARQVTTVAGATSVTVHCRFTKPDGTVLLERDVTGKVRFFGGNLRATYDFAKKAAHIVNENFSPAPEK